MVGRGGGGRLASVADPAEARPAGTCMWPSRRCYNETAQQYFPIVGATPRGSLYLVAKAFRAAATYRAGGTRVGDEIRKGKDFITAWFL